MHMYAPGTHMLKMGEWVKGGRGSHTPKRTEHPQVIISAQFSELAGARAGEGKATEVKCST